MPIYINPERIHEMRQVCGRRLTACRKIKKLTQEHVAKELGHRTVTQVSLHEAGERMPPTGALIGYAEFYGVSVDYLVGRVDDPFLDRDELGETITRMTVTSSIFAGFSQFSDVMSNFVVTAIAGQREDRTDILSLLTALDDVQAAFSRMKELNAETWEDLRGGSTFEMRVRHAKLITEKANKRIQNEMADLDLIDNLVDLESEDQYQQLRIEFGEKMKETVAK